MRLFSDANYHFIESRKKAYVVSGVALLACVLAMMLNVFTIGSWQNYGVDFTGGSLVQVRFEDATTAAQVRAALGGASAPEITRFDQEDEFVIRAPLSSDTDIDAVRIGIEDQLAAAFGAGSFEVLRTELVGPRIGAELQQKAVLAILFSFLLTLAYLAFRFEFRFGLAAIIATVHDILITLGFLAAFKIEIMLPTVAAILTIVGYSLNDTIVVFDRIRENLAKKGARKEDQIALINRSINETLPRTVLTSGTTLVVLVALATVGPAVIRDFALILTMGIVVGTYSSIFVASPALVEIRRRLGEGKPPEKKRRPEPATV
jgi:preprotein translocase subunit SecF